jgi:hypothetical protein
MECFPASEVNDPIPHLKSEHGESQQEEHVQDHNVTELRKRLEKCIHENLHAWHS